MISFEGTNAQERIALRLLAEIAEVERLRDELTAAKKRIAELQQQIPPSPTEEDR